LEQAGQLPNAAVAYLSCGCTKAAERCYEHAGEWQMAFALHLQSPHDAGSVSRLARALVDQLQATGRASEAGTVAAMYLRDGPLALQYYIEAGEWRHALGVVGQLQRPELVEEPLKPAAATAASRLLTELRADEQRIDKYWSRLKLLREKRLQLASRVGTFPSESSCAC
jgi:hypothetical protein